MFKFGKNVDKKLESLVGILPKNGEVLDLGSGLGGNDIFLANLGFSVTCLDKDEEVIEHIKKENPVIAAINKEILEFDFPKEKYDLVLALNVLHFLNLENIEKITKLIVRSLKKDGLFYFKAFSTKDPSYNNFIKFTPNPKEKNTFFSEKMNRFIHFFTKEELADFLSENTILELEEFVTEDDHPPQGKHQHGLIVALIKK